MTEGQPRMEMQNRLGMAVNDVSAYVMQGQVWSHAYNLLAKRHSNFKGRIEDLGKCIERAEEIKKGNHGIFDWQMSMQFDGLKSNYALSLLGDILLSRITNQYTEQDKPDQAEARLMASEMGLPEEGWKSEKAVGLTLEEVVEKVLEGKLRVLYSADPT